MFEEKNSESKILVPKWPFLTEMPAEYGIDLNNFPFLGQHIPPLVLTSPSPPPPPPSPAKTLPENIVAQKGWNVHQRTLKMMCMAETSVWKSYRWTSIQLYIFNTKLLADLGLKYVSVEDGLNSKKNNNNKYFISWGYNKNTNHRLT